MSRGMHLAGHGVSSTKRQGVQRAATGPVETAAEDDGILLAATHDGTSLVVSCIAQGFDILCVATEIRPACE